MKLNFWQWLGVVLLVIGVALWIYQKTRPTSLPPPTNLNPPTATQPASTGPAATQPQ